MIGLILCIAPARKPVAVGNLDRLFGRGAGCPVALGVVRVTPYSLLVPVPDLSPKFSAQAIGQTVKGAAFGSFSVWGLNVRPLSSW